MRITEADVNYVANLANLELTDEERRRMVKDLDSILTYIDRLNELDTTNVSPMAQVFAQPTAAERSGRQQAWRDDSARPSLLHQEAMQNAPDTEGEFFRVPKVIER